MAYKAKQTRFLALALTTALATTVVSGCTTKAAPTAGVSAAKAKSDLARGKSSSAIGHAESAVKADPQNAGFRAGLGATYMEAGRFQSAATSFKDAMTLGDKSSRTALSYALAQIAANKPSEAMRVLNERQSDLNAADVGLAMSLAGEPNKGVRILSDAIRSGENTSKVRQNLAYSYALQGNWRAARLMASEDVPASEINDRIGEWAQAVEAGGQVRVAKLLAVPVVNDKGQPVALALANNPSQDVLVAEAAGTTGKASPESFALAKPVGNGFPPARAESGFAPDAGNAPSATSAGAPSDRLKLAPLARPTAAPVRSASSAGASPAGASSAGASPAATASSANAQPTSGAKPRVAQIAPPARRESAFSQRSSSASPKPSVSTGLARPSQAAAKATGATSRAVSGNQDHLVQLGSFSSKAGAERAWDIYLKRYPHLSREDLVISRANVRGKEYFRVSASGFNKGQAKSLCSTVKTGGYDCFTWALNRPLPGAIDSGVRLARRS